MGFYYFSLLSVPLLGVVYGLLLLLFWGVARVTRGMPGRAGLLGVVGAVFLVLPVAEELWIAWNFGQACKEAGTFIHKKVKVDGFYDDTHGWRPDKLRASGFRFMEGHDTTSGKNSYWRHEFVADQIQSFKIDRPTARYHYKIPYSHAPVAYNVVKHERVVVDSQTREVLARELSYGRYAPWFYIGLDRPAKICRGKREVRGSLYVNVLIPGEPSAKGNQR
jgi:hypothetical protein